MTYVPPNHDGAIVRFRARYENFIGGDWVKPARREYFEDVTPVTGRGFCEVARGSMADVETALDAAHGAKVAWGKTSPSDRANVLSKVADRIEQHLERLAVAESWESGKPIRETLGADLPLAIDHFRYFAGCIRAQESSICEVDQDTALFHFHEPLGVVAQLIPWSFPLLMAAWELAPALVAGNCVVIKSAEQTPASLLMLMDLVGDLIPPGVVNVVSGFDSEVGRGLESSRRVTRSIDDSLHSAVGLGGKSPNLFFEDIFASDDDFAAQAVEGFARFALNQGQVCSSPSRALVAQSILDEFIERAVACTEHHRPGNPLDLQTTVGAQASIDELQRILDCIDVGRTEGARILLGGARAEMPGSFANGYFLEPTIFACSSEMRIFQEELRGPVASVTAFRDFDHAMELANETLYGLAAGVWTRDTNRAYRVGRGIDAGRVWTNCYHLYPAHAAFGGFKQSAVGRENHRRMLTRYQQKKNLLVSYSPKAMGLF